MPLLRAELSGRDVRLVFIDDHAELDSVNGHEVWTFDRFCDEPASSRHAALSVANSVVRKELDLRCVAYGVEVIGASAANVVVMDEVKISQGALLSPFVTICSNVNIGRCFHANLYCYVEHDCEIGDYVTFAPGVHCNGNVVVEESAYIGAGAVIRQGAPGRPLVVGKGAVIGMGAVVTRSIPAGATVVGNPARIINGKI